MIVPDDAIGVAAYEAGVSSYRGHHHGAAVFRRSRVITSAHNSTKTHPLGSGQWKTLHAEVAALIKALRFEVDLSKCGIYVCRIGENGFKLSKPCKCCSSLIAEYKMESYWSGEGVAVDYKCN